MFSLGKLVFSRMNLKPVVLKNFEFDKEMCFHLCEVYCFQNLIGLELLIKHVKSKREMTEMDKNVKIYLWNS